ncbi:MAG: Fic family protein [Pedobacter sp.]|nr:MAG: Fic family protein [Pedobacter sp.]
MAAEDLLKTIKALQRQILKIQPNQVPWDAEYMESVKIDFTFASNNLEGNKITHGQTVQILKDFINPKDTSISDYLDVLNHKKVLDLVFENFESEQITENNIKRLHKELMKNSAQWADDVYYDPGNYKIFENRTYRSSGKEHLYADPGKVHMEMKLLIEETNKALIQNSLDFQFHPLTIASRFHFILLNQIHPFGDGNGRIARIFMNLILLKKGYPPIFVKEVDRREYLECFLKEESNPGSMLEFMSLRMIESLKAKRKFIMERHS